MHIFLRTQGERYMLSHACNLLPALFGSANRDGSQQKSQENGQNKCQMRITAKECEDEWMGEITGEG